MCFLDVYVFYHGREKMISEKVSVVSRRGCYAREFNHVFRKAYVQN